MTKLHPTQKMQEDAVDKLSTQMVKIIHDGEDSKNNTEILTEAIKLCFNSLERFDKIFYSLLLEEEIIKIGNLIDEAVKSKLEQSTDITVSQQQNYDNQKHPFSHIFSSDMFKSIVQGLRDAHVGVVESVQCNDILSAPASSEIDRNSKPKKER